MGHRPVTLLVLLLLGLLLTACTATPIPIPGDPDGNAGARDAAGGVTSVYADQGVADGISMPGDAGGGEQDDPDAGLFPIGPR